MKIEYRVGDALATECAFIVQGVNSKGVMGSGIAKSIRIVYPKVYDEYNAYYVKWGLSLGEVIPVWVDETNYDGHMVGKRVIFNSVTQENFGRDPDVVYVDYQAITDVFDEINHLMFEDLYIDFAKENGSWTGPFWPQIALPLIGAGLANGKWLEIARRIEQASIHFQPVVYVENQEKLDMILSELAVV